MEAVELRLSKWVGRQAGRVVVRKGQETRPTVQPLDIVATWIPPPT